MNEKFNKHFNKVEPPLRKKENQVIFLVFNLVEAKCLFFLLHKTTIPFIT